MKSPLFHLLWCSIPLSKRLTKAIVFTLFFVSTTPMLASNIDGGGTVGFDQTICFGETPSLLQNLTEASGGDESLSIEYLWMQSIPGLTEWQPIAGAIGSSYTPGILNQTTAFLRCARRQGFDNYTGETNTIVITVLAPPITSITQAPVFGIADEELTFGASYLPFVEYLWDFGDGTTANGQNVTHTYSYGNTYTVTLRLTNTMNGCSITIPASTINILGPLPVEMSYFYPETKDDETVLLHWATENELDNAYFEIQQSMDGIRFTNIGQLTGQGTTTSSTAYSYRHDTPIIGENYYRLKQIDEDGSFAFSDIVSITIKKENVPEITLYPNPFIDRINLRLKETSALPMEVSIFDTNHREVWQGRLPAFASKLEIPTTGLVNGFYIVKVKAREFRTSYSVCKID